jgi:hypothetical protein
VSKGWSRTQLAFSFVLFAFLMVAALPARADSIELGSTEPVSNSGFDPHGLLALPIFDTRLGELRNVSLELYSQVGFWFAYGYVEEDDSDGGQFVPVEISMLNKWYYLPSWRGPLELYQRELIFPPSRPGGFHSGTTDTARIR